MATYVIGDLQGCLQPLEELLKSLNFHPDRDRLWLCGDLVNRGPDSLGVLRFLYQRRDHVMSVLGNHDLHLLAVAHGAHPLRRKDTLQEILQAPDRDELLQWLLQCPLLHVDHGRRLLLSHAGLPPHWNIAQAEHYAAETAQALRADSQAFFAHMYGNQPALWRSGLAPLERYRYCINALTRMRYVDAHGALDFLHKDLPGKQKAQLQPWFRSVHLRRENYRLLFGHWASLGANSGLPEIEALDSGCVWGGRLTAYCVETMRRHSVAGWHDGVNIDD